VSATTECSSRSSGSKRRKNVGYPSPRLIYAALQDLLLLQQRIQVLRLSILAIAQI
jgi:hypothetical protein